MRRSHTLSDYETDWSKKVPNRDESMKKCSKQSRKFHPNVPPINLDPFYGTKGHHGNGKHVKVHKEVAPDSEASSATFNYVIEECLPTTVSTVDLTPAKSIAKGNLSRITKVLKRAQEIDCRSSVLYGSNRFQEGTESARPGSPGSTKSSFVVPDQPGADGIIIGAQLNWLRPTTAATQEERDKYARRRRQRLAEERRLNSSVEYAPTRTDPWPYFYRMSLCHPVSRVADHGSEWNESFITGSSLSRPAGQAPVQPETNPVSDSDFRSEIQQFSAPPERPDSESPLLSVHIDLKDFNQSVVNIESNIMAVQFALRSQENSREGSRRNSLQSSRRSSMQSSRTGSRKSSLESLAIHRRVEEAVHDGILVEDSDIYFDPDLQPISETPVEAAVEAATGSALLADDAEDLWEALLSDLRAASLEIEHGDLAEIASMKKPEEAVVAAVG